MIYIYIFFFSFIKNIKINNYEKSIYYDCIYIWNYILYSLEKILFDYILIEGLNIQ